jgi:TolA-binding protein
MRVALHIFFTLCLARSFTIHSPAQEAATREQQIYAEAASLFQKEQYADVVRELLKLPDASRRTMPIEAFYWLGVSGYETGEWSFSQWYLLRAAAEHPSSQARFGARLRLAKIARRVGEQERAVRLLMQALDDAPKERDFLQTALLAIEIQQEAKDYDGAMRTCNELLKAFPDFSAARLQRLRALHRAGRFEECLADSADSIGKVPVQDRAEVSYLMAASHRALGQFAKAAEIYEQLLQMFPFGQLAEDARYELALCHYERGDFAKAARLAESVLRGNPSRAERLRFLWLLADAQAHQSQWQTAKDIYRQIADTSHDRVTSALAIEQMIEMAKRQNRATEVEELTRWLMENRK